MLKKLVTTDQERNWERQLRVFQAVLLVFYESDKVKYLRYTSITLYPVEYLTAEYSSFKTFEKTIIINLDPPQTSKQIYRKLKSREKVLEEFQPLPRFPRKMVWHSSTKFGILKTFTIISNLIRFDLGF